MEKTYVQTYVPDKDRLADLLVRARGRDRFMADFARECGCSPASFTRITKKLITRPLNDALIEEIAKNAAPDSGVDLDMLMRANGKLPEGDCTIFKCEGDLSRFHAQEGEIVDVPWSDMLCRTQVKVKLDDFSYFLTRPINNHHILVRGKHAAEMEAFFRILG